MATQLVETTDEHDVFVAVLEHIGSLIDAQETAQQGDTSGSQFVSECKALLVEMQHAQLLDKLIPRLNLVFSSASKDVECCANIVCHVAAHAGAEGSPDSFDKVIAAAVADPSNADARLAMLISLYNATPEKALQYRVLLAAMQFATSTQQSDALAGVASGKAEVWARSFQLDAAATRHLYITIAALLGGTHTPAMRREAFKLNSQALGLVAAGDTAALGETAALATATVREFISNQTLYQCDLLELPAVKQLEGLPEGAGLYALLGAVLRGDLAAFNATDVGAVLGLHGPGEDLKKEQLADKMRMMSLISLAAANLHKELPFETVEAALGLGAGQVEAVVVAAISRKLIDGRMDQLKRAVVITRTSQPTFGEPEWAQLQRELSNWATSIEGINELVHTAVPRELRGLS